MDWVSNLDGSTFWAGLIGAAIGAVIGGVFTLAGVALEQRSANKRAEDQLRKQWVSQECAEILRHLSSFTIEDYWRRKRGYDQEWPELPPLLDRPAIMTHVHRLKVWMESPEKFQTELETVLEDLEATWLPPGLTPPRGDEEQRPADEYPDAVYKVHEDYRRRVDAALATLPHVDEKDFLKAILGARLSFHDEFRVMGLSFGFTIDDTHNVDTAEPS